MALNFGEKYAELKTFEKVSRKIASILKELKNVLQLVMDI